MEVINLITFFNKKILVTESNPIELARVRELLNNVEIPYAEKTVTSRGSIGRNIDSNIRSDFNQAYSSNLTYINYLYVRKKDYVSAKSIIS
jgi:hypothetical protein